MALGRLDAISTLLPDPHLFIYTYVRKEAVLSSQIEGTQSSLSDLLLFDWTRPPASRSTTSSRSPATSPPWSIGLARLRGGFPLSQPADPRDARSCCRERTRRRQEPGEFRRVQNWIGGTRPGNARLRSAAARRG